MLKLYFILLFGFQICISSAQDISELKEQFFHSSENKLKNAELLRDYFLDNSPDSLYIIGMHLIRKGYASENLSWVHFGKLISASYYFEHGKTQQSYANLYACLGYYEYKKDLEKLADAQNLMGLSYLSEQRNREAIDYFLKSMTTASQLPEENESYMAQLNLSETFARLEKYDMAIKELQKFIDKVKKQHLNKGLRKAYHLLGEIYFETEHSEKGIQAYKTALDLALKEKDKMGLSTAYNNMGIAYFQNGQFDLSKENFEKGLDLRKKLNNPRLICDSYFNLGAYYSNLDQLKNAEKYCQLEFDLATHFDLMNEKSDALTVLISIYEQNKDYKKAYECSQKLIEIKSEILEKRNREQENILTNFQKSQEDHQFYVQKKQVEKLESQVDRNQNKLFLTIGCSALMMLVFIGMVSRRKSV